MRSQGHHEVADFSREEVRVGCRRVAVARGLFVYLFVLRVVCCYSERVILFLFFIIIFCLFCFFYFFYAWCLGRNTGLLAVA